ncbi:MAG: transcriptional repressor [bacterium]|nr:MAG: transcriptional repressor [bacterium]
MHSFENTIQKLRSEGFKLTPQRLAVIKYMIGNKSHPSALAIHKELKRRYPTLSFSTVYNTLNMLQKIDEIRSIHVFDDHLNYDPNTEPHIHFLCSKCDMVHDIFLEQAEGIQVYAGEIDGHLVDSYELFFKGTCKDCR